MLRQRLVGMSCAGKVPEGGREAKAAAEEPQEKEEPKGSLSLKPEPKKPVPALQILSYYEMKHSVCRQYAREPQRPSLLQRSLSKSRRPRVAWLQILT